MRGPPPRIDRSDVPLLDAVIAFSAEPAGAAGTSLRGRTAALHGCPSAMLAPVALHAGEIPVDESVVRALLQEQRPDLADSTIEPVGGGTDNTMYRLGAQHVARFPRTPEKAAPLLKELTWLPRLAPDLSHPVPTPVHAGRPGQGYPLPWAVMTWIDGEDMTARAVTDWADYSRDLATFVASLHSADLRGASRSGPLDWYRGGSLQPLRDQVSASFAALRTHRLRDDVDLARLQELWQQALQLPEPSGAHVWLHSDLRPSNVLTRHGRLCAVIDFGALSVGHPDAEHVAAWDLPTAARQTYRSCLQLDDLTWARARAWAIALSVGGIVEYSATLPSLAAECLQRLEAITTDDASRAR